MGMDRSSREFLSDGSIFPMRYEELSSVDSEWGQGGQELWDSRKLWNDYLENMGDS